MDEGEWHELGESTGLRLEITGAHDMTSPVHRVLDGAEHDRDVGAKTDSVCGSMGIEPFLGVDLVRTDDSADLVIEDLGGRARQSSEPCIHQSSEVLLKWLTQSLGSLSDLKGSESMHMDVWCGFFHCPGDIDVVIPVEVRMDPSLEADLGGSQRSRLGRTPGQILESEQVRGSTEVQ